MTTPSLPAKVEIYTFEDDGKTPNHPTLPVVILRGTPALEESDAAAWFEKYFSANHWGGNWRWTVYPYHHFHSDNHEVLGVSKGHAEIQLGGEAGKILNVTKGDVIILPAGTGHKRISASDDFEVVGGYPGGHEPNLIRSMGDRADALRLDIQNTPTPTRDPVYGSGGPMLEAWGV